MLKQLETVAVAVRSADESVTARMTATAGLEITVDRIAHHDETSLETELRQAMSDALAEFHRVCEEIRREHHEQYGDPARGLAPRSRAGLAEYIAELDDIVVVGRSVSGATRVKRRGDDHIDVRIRPGTVSALPLHAIQGEIDAAVTSAAHQYAGEQSRLYRAWFPNGRIGKLPKERQWDPKSN